MKKLFNYFLDFLYPDSSHVRGFHGTTPEKLLAICPPAENTPGGDIFSLYDYKNEAVKRLVWELKFRRNRKIAKLLGQVLFEHIISETSDLETFSDFREPLLIPIPLSKERQKERGYNQAALLCEEIVATALLCEEIVATNGGSLKIMENILVKIKNNPHQTDLARSERLKNMKNCFAVTDQSKISGKNIVLIDDVTTTGATLREAMNELKKSGAENVIAFTVAH
ncbi:hypothetical protein KW783_02960 [Candidatus Parcubacteria bacterium]|nr:hypothetical protein [Candidatus Parcubacteria bacterium]